MQLYGRKYKQENLSISKQVMKKIQKYKWPGNIRELQHAVEKVIILSETNVVKSTEYFISSDKGSTAAEVSSEIPKTLEDMEAEMIRHSLKLNHGNMSKVAEALGITRATLYRKMEKFEI
ncbi:helix-turn-helix domain-containing protein [Bacteroidota bacterium]